MQCALCGTEMLVDHMETELRGDDSAAAQTYVFQIPVMVCRRSDCAGFGVAKKGEKIQFYPAETQEMPMKM